jgi:hypothetical protein
MLVTNLGEQIPMAIGLWKFIAIECDGTIVTGSYCTSDWMITVKTKGGTNKSSSLGIASPEILAKSLLYELAQQERTAKPH